MKNIKYTLLSLATALSLGFSGCGDSGSSGDTPVTIVDVGHEYYPSDSKMIINAVGMNAYYQLSESCSFSPYGGNSDVTIYSDYTAKVVFQWNGDRASYCKVIIMSVGASDGAMSAAARGDNYYRDNDSHYGLYLADANRAGTLKVTQIINNGKTAVVIDEETKTESYVNILFAYFKPSLS